MKRDSTHSNVTAFPNKALIKEQAGDWLAKIDQGSLTPEQVEAFQQWLSQSEFHRQYLEKLARNWDSMSILSELAELFPLNEPEQQPKVETSRVSRLPFWMMTAISACLLAAVLTFNLNTETQQYTTSVGQQSSVTLVDGTKVDINTDSHLQVDFSGDIRAVHLFKGEANFEVAKNPKRPFVVYAGSGMVWAVGTEFNVRYTDDNVDVMVTEGTIKVYAEAEQHVQEPQLVLDSDSALDLSQYEAIAIAGQSISFSQTIQQHDEVEPEVVDKKLAWHSGHLSFSGESLEQALEEISRYTDKKIVIVDPGIKDIQVGGYFKTSDIDGLLASLGQGFDLKVEHVSPQRIHVSEQR